MTMTTSWRSWILSALCLLGMASSALAQGEKPRVIVLAFDGVDHATTEKFIAEGRLPNLNKLASQGSFARLETTNPAESAVSWSTFGRGLNPGTTNMLGFVCRKPGDYMPEIRFMGIGEAPFSDYYDGAEAEAGPASGGSLAWLPWAAGIAGFMLGMLGGLLVAGSTAAGVALGLVCGGGAAIAAVLLSGESGESTSVELPDTVPTLEQMVKGETLWGRLDDAGVRVKGFLVPMSTPMEPLENGQMLGGLGVPDVYGSSTGKYFIFSTSREDVPVGDMRDTASSSKVIRLVEQDGAYTAALIGPKDTVRKQQLEREQEGLKAKIAKGDLDPAARGEMNDRLKEIATELKSRLESESKVVVRRAGEREVEVTVSGTTVVVKEGDWSPWFPVRYTVSWPLDAAGLGRFRVLDAGDDIRLFFAPIGYDPREIPAHMQIEYPPGFAKRIAEEAGVFDTTGWACLTNPLKDVEVEESVFLEHIELLTQERSKVVYHELAKDDYDFFFAMFGETDRVQHLMYRAIDPDHPMYDPAIAEKYGSCVVDVYRSMDEVVGQVMERFVDDNTVLFVVSDHGFTSFRRQVALNTWLMEEGYLVPKGGARDPAELLDALPGIRSDYLLYMDRKKSRAFALGLGKIYINLKGREKEGVVTQDEYEALCEEMTQKLLALRDPETGAQVVRRVWRNHELYSGEYAETDADLYLGFEKYYRISWSTTTGGFSAATIEDNDSKWSGDHASNDPEVVPGIVFCSGEMEAAERPGIIDMAPTILGIYGVAADGMDGRVLPVK